MKNKGIAVAGSIITDEINTVSDYPKEGELTQITAVSKAVGGCVPNVAADLKKILPELRVSAIGKVGSDENARFVKKFLEDRGVNTDMITEAEGRTSFTQVISVSRGQRTFFTYPGASADFGLSDMDFEKIDADIFHLGYFLLLKKVDGGDGIKILKAAREKGMETSIDLVSENSDRYKLVLPCLPHTDYLIVNELEAGRLAGTGTEIKDVPATAEKLIKLGVNKKVVIHFREGSVCCDRNGGLTVLGSYLLPEGHIKGSTGAGDAFCAGALAAIYKGLSDEKILEYGTACAAAALTSEDAVSGVTDINTALESCRGFERNELCL